RQEADAILGVYDFSNVGSLVDVGGGQGALLAVILSAYPHLHAILFEQPDVIERARDVMIRAGVATRCEPRSGDFFKAVPPGGAVSLLKSVLQNWDDEQSVAILSNCCHAMSVRSRL